MRLPLIHPPTQLDICVIGDVTIHEGAVVAPGTILQAAPNSRIVIREGACIGMGTLINAYQGDIEIQSGAMLGSGVLVIGQSKIGKNACIGSSTTIINTSIEPGTTIKAGSLIGDTSRPFSTENSESFKETTSETNGSSGNNNGLSSEPSREIKSETNRSLDYGKEDISNGNNSSPSPQMTKSQKPAFVEEIEDVWLETATEVDESAEIPSPSNPPPKPPPENQNSPVVGQIYINNLLCTLFPERQAFTRSQPDLSSDA